jgi:hypothetical protein
MNFEKLLLLIKEQIHEKIHFSHWLLTYSRINAKNVLLIVNLLVNYLSLPLTKMNVPQNIQDGNCCYTEYVVYNLKDNLSCHRPSNISDNSNSFKFLSSFKQLFKQLFRAIISLSTFP